MDRSRRVRTSRQKRDLARGFGYLCIAIGSVLWLFALQTIRTHAAEHSWRVFTVLAIICDAVAVAIFLTLAVWGIDRQRRERAANQ